MTQQIRATAWSHMESFLCIITGVIAVNQSPSTLLKGQHTERYDELHCSLLFLQTLKIRGGCPCPAWQLPYTFCFDTF